MSEARVYPLVLEPLVYEKVWGGRRLERYGKALPAGKRIGESWEVADLAATSATGAGGGAARSVIANGALRGQTLHEAVAAWGTGLLGDARATSDGGFPLLVKFLDARENLSVQVHPSAAYAAAHAGAHLKTECWYVLEAEAGSVIYAGVRAGVTRERFESQARAAAAGMRGEELVASLDAVAAIPGACHTLPSGTVHALGAGVLVAEVQTPSDTTYRLYDWGRSGRALHVEEALACASLGAAPAAERWSGPASGVGRCRLARTAHFTVDEVRGGGGAWSPGPGCSVVMVAGPCGGGRVGSIESEDGSFEAVELRVGTTAIIPAAVAGAARVRAEGAARVLAIGVCGAGAG